MKILKKLIIVVAIIALCGVGALIDYFIAQTYEFEFVSVERVSEAPVYDENGQEVPIDTGIADGSTRVKIVVKLTQNGNPVSGHTLYIKTNRNVLGRMVTDENGNVVIEYRCYKATGSKPVTPITLSVRDEDNSVFVFVPATGEYVLKMIKGNQVQGSGMTTDDIFYDIKEGE